MLKDQTVLLGVGRRMLLQMFLCMYMSAFGCFLCVFSIPKAVLVLLVVVFLNNENEIDIT